MDEVDPLAVVTEAAQREAPSLTSLVAQINALGYGTPEYFDCMAFLFITLARSQWRRADQARASVRRTERIATDRARDGRRHVVHAICSVCSTKVRLNLDGRVRAHVTGSAGGWRSTNGRDGARCDGSGRPPAA